MSRSGRQWAGNGGWRRPSARLWRPLRGVGCALAIPLVLGACVPVQNDLIACATMDDAVAIARGDAILRAHIAGKEGQDGLRSFDTAFKPMVRSHCGDRVTLSFHPVQPPDGEGVLFGGGRQYIVSLSEGAVVEEIFYE